MSDQDRRRLREIHTFPALVRYLREELGWPVDQDNFDDLDDITFDWEADELGIDPDQAARIEYIKQLRPLENGQPQGVFFVKFDTKSLPVVALRRLLSKLVVKKRATARAAERPLWAMRDLVFISSYGHSDERQLSFAYFQESDHPAELPTLKVLGWDDRDTALYLDRVHDRLSDFLTWPKSAQALPQWRKDWSKAFDLRHGEIVTTAKQLAEQLAALAIGVRERALQLLRLETETGPLRVLMEGFKKALIHDLTEDQFADMYAQTISYGLLSARITHPDPVKAETLSDLIPVTNPFLKELMATFVAAGGKQRGRKASSHLDFDELGINEVVELLRRADMDAVLRNFGAEDRREDPVTYFYEDFLNAYDAKERKRRGVYYTPKPVVSYIVRGVHELLQSEFGIDDGLASTITWGEMANRHEGFEVPTGVSKDSPFVRILDPATGTATFLVAAIEVILTTLTERWTKAGLSERQQLDAWNKYVPEHLLPRLFGYELMMAPYAIAHLKIGLKLFETGYRFDSDARAQIYLTNSLEPASDERASQVDALSEALAHEAQAVNNVKRTQRFIVVIGNPPYFAEAGRGNEWIASLMRGVDLRTNERTHSYFEVDGASLGERTSKWINDDYVKFLRLADREIERSSMGILGFITNHSWLDNPTFRGVRQGLLKTFQRVRVLDLHGNSTKKERSPDGSSDENVFDIKQGVAVTLAARRIDRQSISDVSWSELWGTRESKYRVLIENDTQSRRTLVAKAPEYLLIPEDVDIAAEFSHGIDMGVLFPLKNHGIITKRDGLTIHFTEGEVWQTVTAFAGCKPRDAYKLFDLPPDVRDWSVVRAQADVVASGPSKRNIRRLCYRPLNFRYTYYTGNARGFIGWPVEKIMRHLLDGRNTALVTTRQTKDRWGIVVADTLVGHKACGGYDVNTVFPLYLFSSADKHDLLMGESDGVSANLDSDSIVRIEKAVGRRFSIRASDAECVTPENIQGYVYGVLHSEIYRRRYEDFLKRMFPRIPIPASPNLFDEIAGKGCALIALHLLKVLGPTGAMATYNGNPSPTVERIRWDQDRVWIDATSCFTGVSSVVWSHYIGGYQVCEKWLKDRKGRTLSNDDIDDFQKIVAAIAGTIRITKEIDEVIERHGGWPRAFETTGLSQQS